MSVSPILWGHEPPEYVASPEEAQLLYLNGDLCPGLVSFDGGTRSFSLRMEQEQRTFTTYVYFSGYKIPAWKASFKIWNAVQYREAVRLCQKYQPNPIKKLTDLEAIQVTNPILKENGYRMMLINDWSPMTAPKEGLEYVYEFMLLQAFPARFLPKAARSSSSETGNAFDVPQDTEAAINPTDQSLPEDYDRYRAPVDPAEAYMTPANPFVDAEE